MAIDSSEGLIGARVKRVEAQRFVRGRGTYVDDRRAEGMLHLAVVRSPYAHARILGVDAAAAAALPGVAAVLTGPECARLLKPLQGRGTKPLESLNYFPLATDRVRFVGDPVAVVAATSPYVAQDGADLVEVVFEPLPAVVDPELAMGPDAQPVFEELPDNCLVRQRFATDDVDAAFAAADAVVTLTTHSARAAACPMEPRSYAAEFDPRTGTLTIWASTANPFTTRSQVSSSLGLPEGRVRVIVSDVGGSFGSKNAGYPEEILVALVACRTGRPAKWTETRTEHLRVTRQGRDQTHHLRGAFSRDGRLLAVEDRIVADLGATPQIDASVSSATAYVPGPYRLPQYRVETVGVATNKPAHGSLRGIGKADAAFAIERLMDRAARQLGIDPAEIRLRNLVDEDQFPYRTVTGALLDSGRYKLCLRTAMDRAGYERLRAEARELRAQGVHRGVGVSFVIEPTSASRPGGGAFASCRIAVNPSGRVFAYSGMSQQGQGHETTIAQIIADRLRIPMDAIDVFLSDTHVSPFGFGTGSSRSATVLMSAVYVGAEKVRAKLAAIAAHSLGVAAEALHCEAGRFTDPAGRSLTLQEIARTAYHRVDRLPPGMEPGIEETGTFVNPNIIYEPDAAGRYNAFASYPYDAVVAAVDVDAETGAIAVRTYVSCHDCGTVINPTVVETQHCGATVQGLGLALFEELPYDGDGQPLGASFMDYLPPTVNDLPVEMAFEHLVTPSPFTPLGAKGAGETGTLSPPAALAAAIEDALAPLKIEMSRTPFTAERVAEAVRLAREVHRP